MNGQQWTSMDINGHERTSMDKKAHDPEKFLAF